jgi:hypothetical protein
MNGCVVRVCTKTGVRLNVAGVFQRAVAAYALTVAVLLSATPAQAQDRFGVTGVVRDSIAGTALNGAMVS